MGCTRRRGSRLGIWVLSGNLETSSRRNAGWKSRIASLSEKLKSITLHGDRDWAHLPLVPLHLISEKLKSITDYVRFHAVCSPWRLAAHPKPRHLPLQLPWLMIPYVSNQRFTHNTDDGMRFFYDLWESKMRKLHLPETIGKSCCATYRGWLLLVADKGSELFLLNPLTRARVDLPPFTTPVTHIWADDEEDRAMGFPPAPPMVVDYLFSSYMGTHIITKVTFSSDLTDPNCLIMLFFERCQGIFFCRLGDCRWTEVVRPPRPNGELADAAYHNGSFYLLQREVIYIYDLRKHKEQGVYLFKPELRADCKFFLVGKSGLYLVAAHFSEEGQDEPEEGVERVPNQSVVMYKFIDTEERVNVQPITDTSDTTIFYGDNYHYLAVSADEWDSLSGSSMYIEYMCSSLTRYGNYRNRNQDCYDILFASLNSGESQPVANGIGEAPNFFPAPPAMWFQPTFG